jgi:hypothetical protein
MGGRASKQKGSRFELSLAKAIGGRKVPLSGAAAGWKGDVIGPDGLRYECKVRKDGFKQIYSWLEDNDRLVIKADRKDPLVVMRLPDYIKITEGNEKR